MALCLDRTKEDIKSEERHTHIDMLCLTPSLNSCVLYRHSVDDSIE